MSDYTIIDAHVHTYQSREVGLQAKQGSTATDFGGTVDELLPIMEKAGISKSVMVNMLPLAEMQKAAINKLPDNLSESEREKALEEIDAKMLSRLERRNSWTCNIAHENPGLIPFINLDPLQNEASIKSELADKVNKHGAKGIKLHPGSQWFYPNDNRLWPIYRAAQETGLPIVFHAGQFLSPVPYSQPKNFVDVLEAFPEMTLVMAHIGFGFQLEALSLSKTYPNLQFDCSAIISQTTKDGKFTEPQLTTLIKEIGIERVMFGSDFPWYDPADSVERLLRLDFSEEEKRMLLAENAISIYKL